LHHPLLYVVCNVMHMGSCKPYGLVTILHFRCVILALQVCHTCMSGVSYLHVRCVICKPYRLMASLYHRFPCLLCVMCKPCRLLRTAHTIARHCVDVRGIVLTIARHCVHDCSSQNLKLRVKGDADVLVSCSLFMVWCLVSLHVLVSCSLFSSVRTAGEAPRRQLVSAFEGNQEEPRRMSCGAQEDELRSAIDFHWDQLRYVCRVLKA